VYFTAASVRSGGLRRSSGECQPGSLDVCPDRGEDRVWYAFQLHIALRANRGERGTPTLRGDEITAQQRLADALPGSFDLLERTKGQQHGDLPPRVQPDLVVLSGGMLDHADRDQVLPPVGLLDR
jgi:hypothetical protein